MATLLYSETLEPAILVQLRNKMTLFFFSLVRMRQYLGLRSFECC